MSVSLLSQLSRELRAGEELRAELVGDDPESDLALMAWRRSLSVAPDPPPL